MYNQTGSGVDGYHYDALVRSGAGVAVVVDGAVPIVVEASSSSGEHVDRRMAGVEDAAEVLAAGTDSAVDHVIAGETENAQEVVVSSAEITEDREARVLGRHAGAPVTQEHGARGTEDLEPWEEELRRRCTPAVIDYVKCLGRTYAGGRGGQCGKTVKKDGLCGRCGGGSGPAHGLVTGRVPKAKWKAFGISEADVQRLREGEGAAGLKTAGGSCAPARVRPASEALGSNAGGVSEASQLVAPEAVRPTSVAASQGSVGVAGLGVAPSPASASAPRQALLKRRRVAGAKIGPDDVVAQDPLQEDVSAPSAAIGDSCAREGSHMLGSSVDRPNLAAEYAHVAESRRSLLLLSDEDIGRVLQRFLVDHAIAGEAVQVVDSDICRVRAALVSDARLQEVIQHLLGGSLLSRGGHAGQDFWSRMVREFPSHLHLVHRPPRRLGD